MPLVVSSGFDDALGSFNSPVGGISESRHFTVGVTSPIVTYPTESTENRKLNDPNDAPEYYTSPFFILPNFR